MSYQWLKERSSQKDEQEKLIRVHELIHCPNNSPSMLSSHCMLAEILVPLESQTVLLGQKAHFFCQIQGRYQNLRLRIDGRRTSLNFNVGGGLIITTENETSVYTSIVNINITITATKQLNNTKLECYDVTLGRESASNATLIIQGRSAILLLIIWITISCATGGPAEPEVEYEVLQDEKEILFLWPHPFTWKDYPITEYHIVCRDKHRYIINTINDTEIASVINHTVDLPPYLPDCYTLQCNVTASNALGSGQTSITNISFPTSKSSIEVFTESVVTIKPRGGSCFPCNPSHGMSGNCIIIL